MALTAAESPSSFPQSSTGLRGVSLTTYLGRYATGVAQKGEAGRV
jgi:hypothetical protein